MVRDFVRRIGTGKPRRLVYGLFGKQGDSGVVRVCGIYPLAILGCQGSFAGNGR